MVTKAEVREALSGPVPSISTPYAEDGTIDYAALRKMIDFKIDNGAKAIVLTAGDSHYLAMSDEEIREVTRVTVEQTAGRALTVAADRYFDTRQALAFAEDVKDMGADVLMLMPPDWAASNTPASLGAHYAAVAEVMPVMIVTNVYVPRGEAFGLETLREAKRRTGNIVSVKDDMCGVFARKLAAEFGSEWAVWAGGQKQNHLNMAHYGACGYLSTFMKFCPQVAWDYWKACEAGDWTKAARIIREIDMPFFQTIGAIEGGFDVGIHAAFEIFGLGGRWRPHPYRSASDEDVERLRAFFREKGLL